MISKYESALPKPWSGDLPQEYRERMVKAIVAFEIPIIRIEGKFKLGQNRSSEDQHSVVQALCESNDAGAQTLAEFTVKFKQQE